MRTRLLQLAKGQIEYLTPEVFLETEKLTGVALPGKKQVIEVGITSLNGVPMRMFFYSKNPRVSVGRQLSIGRSSKMTVTLNTVGLSLFDRVTGEIVIVYNGGEKILPYEFTIGFARSAMPAEPITTVRDFYLYAQEFPEDAKKVFLWPEFMTFPFMKDLRLYGLYHTYASGSRDDGGMAEFFRAAGCTETDRREGDGEDAKPEKTLAARSVPGRVLKAPSEGAEEKRLRAEKLVKTARLWLSYDRASDDEEKELLLSSIRALSVSSVHEVLTDLLYAWACVDTGKTQEAKRILIAVQDEVQKDRIRQRDVYCLFLYLAGAVGNDEEKKTNAVKLAHRYFQDGTFTVLMILLEYRLNPEYAEDRKKASDFLRSWFVKGITHPVLLQETCRLWESGKPAIPVLTQYELSALLYGLRNGLISEKKLFEVLSHELKNPALLNLYMTALKTSYGVYRNIEVLQVIVSVSMQRKLIGKRCFKWYHEAVQRNVLMNGLYEYDLASLPPHYEEMLPRPLIRYFGLGDRRIIGSKDLLFLNVLRHYADDGEIMSLYEDRILDYALLKMRDDQYSPDLLPVFRHVMTEKNLNEETKKLFRNMLSVCVVRTSSSEAKRLVIHYPELEREARFKIADGAAVVPVWTDNAIIACENGSGNRFFDPSLSVERAFTDEETARLLQDVRTDNLLTKIANVEDVFRRGTARENDVIPMIDIIQEKGIDPFFRTRLYESFLELSESPSMAHVDASEFLMEADYAGFTNENRLRLLTHLAAHGFLKQVYQYVAEFGDPGLPSEERTAVVKEMLKSQAFRNEPALNALCYGLYREGTADNDVLNYLNAYFEGGKRDMSALLKTLKKKRAEYGQLLSRTLTEGFYTNNDRDLDLFYEWYSVLPQQDPALRQAYLVYRSYTCFKKGRKPCRLAQELLKKDVRTLPEISLLAVLTLLSEDPKRLQPDEKKLAEELLETAARRNIALGCFSKFEGHVQLPAEMQGRVFLEYRSETAKEISVVGQILPSRHYFHRSLRQVYPGVFVRSFILYRREWLQYYFMIREADGNLREEEGAIVTQERAAVERGSLYEDIVLLEQKVRNADTMETAEYLRSMLLKQRMTEEIFS
ncbi:MAG: hypothetical protein J6Z38_08070 [Lachnospiraceae bacterium]|nr:hypothetical protein [Lachnospiraceae bacterium]